MHQWEHLAAELLLDLHFHRPLLHLQSMHLRQEVPRQDVSPPAPRQRQQQLDSQ